MKRGLILFTALLAFAAASLFAAPDPAEAPIEIPQNIRNNQYFRESLRLANLAHLSYDEGDYDSSANYAEEAVRYARLSDEFVALQLKIKEVNDAIAAAKERLDWALSVGAHTRYPTEYEEGRQHYSASLNYRTAQDWDEAIDEANKVIAALASIQRGEPSTVLPAQYTVRTWAGERDCFWNIAGRPWVYGNPHEWRRLYNANRAKLPDPNNPDIIEPGTVLDIPSLRGETRQGMWQASRSYSPLR
jgi:tetratricopeptide (TPR) repeat protein